MNKSNQLTIIPKYKAWKIPSILYSIHPLKISPNLFIKASLIMISDEKPKSLKILKVYMNRIILMPTLIINFNCWHQNLGKLHKSLISLHIRTQKSLLINTLQDHMKILILQICLWFIKPQNKNIIPSLKNFFYNKIKRWLKIKSRKLKEVIIFLNSFPKAKFYFRAHFMIKAIKT